MEAGSKRQANFELLRIVAMLMIISLHYLGKGGLVDDVPVVGDGNPAGWLAWLIEAFCLVAVNCYVLISGYFCMESVWKPGRVVSLLCQVLFYALLIPCVLIGVGVVAGDNIGVYDWVDCVLPLETEHYWFATAYLILYLFAPFLTAGIRQMEKRQLQVVIALLLFFFSIGKTIFPVLLVGLDRDGYDFGWFLCLFVVGGYIRKYGITWLERRFYAVIVYAFSCVMIWGLAIDMHALGQGHGVDTLFYYEKMPYTYNYVLCLTGAVSLFYVFKNMKIKEGPFAEAIRKLAPYTFGIYLLHEHEQVRWRWTEWLGVGKVARSFRFVPHMIGCVLLIYVVGTAVDAVRAWLFRRAVSAFGKRMGKGK